MLSPFRAPRILGETAPGRARSQEIARTEANAAESTSGQKARMAVRSVARGKQDAEAKEVSSHDRRPRANRPN